jgi:hypothetical protein
LTNPTKWNKFATNHNILWLSAFFVILSQPEEFALRHANKHTENKQKNNRKPGR